MNAKWVMLSLVILVVVLPTAVFAQDCMIAPYADPEGTLSWMEYWGESWTGRPIEFSVYIVMFTEDVVAAAAYKLNVANEGVSIFLQGRINGPSGNGLSLDENPASIGTNVALGECVIGFGGLPVLVEEYQYIAVWTWYGSLVTLEANTNQNPLYPEYVTCNDVQKDCAVGPDLYVGAAFPVEQTSFSSIKNLFR